MARRKTKEWTMAQLRDAVRDAVYDVFNDAGYKITRKGVDKSVYIDESRNRWVNRETGTVVVNYEVGHIASPAWSEIVDDLIFDVNDELKRTLGKGFFIEHDNAAISTLEIPHTALINLSKGFSYRGGEIFTRVRKR